MFFNILEILFGPKNQTRPSMLAKRFVPAKITLFTSIEKTFEKSQNSEQIEKTLWAPLTFAHKLFGKERKRKESLFGWILEKKQFHQFLLKKNHLHPARREDDLNSSSILSP